MPFNKMQDNKKTKKQTIEGSLGEVYIVDQPYDGCQVGQLVTKTSPITGVDPERQQNVAAVFPSMEMAQSFAEGLYTEYCMKKEALEEKKNKVTEALKKTLGELEKRRSGVMETIKENPMRAKESRHTIAQLTEKIDELMTKLERIELSKENLEKGKDKDKLKDKKK
jgi:uncharacterized protein (UPF0335 family)